MTMATAPIDMIFGLFERHGQDAYGEDISQLQHALQCAELARRDGAAPAIIAAALLHDVGQLIDDAGHAAERHGRDARHEAIGYDILSRMFGDDVAMPVRLHVDAKRYLCAIDAAYQGQLSRASTISLALQGGPMDPAEAEAFANHRYFAAAIRLRRYDDDGKRPDWAVPDLASYRDLLTGLVQRSFART
jgi:phosphonate degradation associated HDIG domain protein